MMCVTIATTQSATIVTIINDEAKISVMPGKAICLVFLKIKLNKGQGDPAFLLPHPLPLSLVKGRGKGTA